MGFGEAIARVTQGVKQGGLPFVMAELGEQLRSDAIPERLRPAASRLAALLRQPEPPRPVISLHDVPEHAHAHVDASAAGVCPFTGARADGVMAQAFAADLGPAEPKVDAVVLEDEPELPREPVVVEVQEDVIDAAPAAPVVEATVVQLEMPIPSPAPSSAPQVPLKKEQGKRNESLQPSLGQLNKPPVRTRKPLPSGPAPRREKRSDISGL